jgi:hypothetical protein
MGQRDEFAASSLLVRQVAKGYFAPLRLRGLQTRGGWHGFSGRIQVHRRARMGHG